MGREIRKALYESIYNEMSKNNNIVSISSDLGKPNGLHQLESDFPERAFNVGIAEAGMALMAAGMATYDLIPIINTFGPFATRRMCDQIAISICYSNQNVKIIGTDPGISAELNGGTHMAVEDIGVLRSIPNIVILEPADEIELIQMVSEMISYKGPCYLRVPRKTDIAVHNANYQLQWGKAEVFREGSDVSIITSGIMVEEAIKAADLLQEKHHINAEILNIHMIKPIDREAIVSSAKKTGSVVVAENHNVLGGLRSAVCEVLSEEYPVKIKAIGIQDMKGQVGKMNYLKQEYKMTAENIAEACLHLI